MRPSNPALNVLLWVLLSFLTLFPIYWLFVISVKPAVDLFTTPSVFLDTVYWKNYTEVLGDETLRRYMTNSIIVATSNSILCSVLAFMACYALSRFDLAARRTSSSGRSPTAWRPPRSSCCRSSCCSPRSS